MVTKMKYISITGHIASMNHTVNHYLSRYEIQLEQARHDLMEPFTTLNPYAQTLQKAERFYALVGVPPALHIPMRSAEAVNLVEAAAAAYEARDTKLRELEENLSKAKRESETLQHFSSLEINLQDLQSLEFIHYRFGRFSAENFLRFEKYLQDDNRILFSTAKKEKDFVYGIFFTPMSNAEEIDAIFASLNYDVFSFNIGNSPTPAALLHHLRVSIHESETEITTLTRDVIYTVCDAQKLAVACAKVRHLYAAFDVKKYAAVSVGRRIFTFSGWISASDAESLEAEIESDDLLVFTRHIVGDDEKPPILLKNLPIIRKFEFFTRLYGLPEYGEVDPTPLLAITYTLLFGLMFGDIGHGLVLAAAGIYIQRKWHPNLGGIMTVVGFSAAFFGVLYGSAFGLEFQPLWRRPTTDISETLIFAAALGAGLIMLSMMINMYNLIRRGKVTDLLFGANGISGLLFYSAIIWIVIRTFVQNHPITPLTVFVAALPLVFVCFKRPMEIFETLIAYATNTISFVRVGAFAVSHVGMMHVVLQLSQSAAGTQNFLILILGNALVLSIEGLLVGIQVLRLDFYEIFSRFYKGSGKAFKSSKGT
ncbi:MAG: hypothetical protein FWF81_06435 [Defluviitaleaceae bacterium]|nr:hypothetical protein [Defluviitaleaceae bacterium]